MVRSKTFSTFPSVASYSKLYQTCLLKLQTLSMRSLFILVNHGYSVNICCLPVRQRCNYQLLTLFLWHLLDVWCFYKPINLPWIGVKGQTDVRFWELIIILYINWLSIVIVATNTHINNHHSITLLTSLTLVPFPKIHSSSGSGTYSSPADVGWRKILHVRLKVQPWQTTASLGAVVNCTASGCW